VSDHAREAVVYLGKPGLSLQLFSTVDLEERPVFTKALEKSRPCTIFHHGEANPV
jgi:hypothetical protein